MSIHRLPVELVTEIVLLLDKSSLSRLVRVNRSLHSIFSKDLYVIHGRPVENEKLRFPDRQPDIHLSSQELLALAGGEWTSVLRWAVEERRMEILHIALRAGLRVSDVPDLLGAAVVSKDLSILKLLLETGGIDVNRPCYMQLARWNWFLSSAPPLCGAASLGDLSAVKLLVSHGANSSVKGKRCPTALGIAVANADSEMAQYLLQTEERHQESPEEMPPKGGRQPAEDLEVSRMPATSVEEESGLGSSRVVDDTATILLGAVRRDMPDVAKAITVQRRVEMEGINDALRKGFLGTQNACLGMLLEYGADPEVVSQGMCHDELDGNFNTHHYLWHMPYSHELDPYDRQDHSRTTPLIRAVKANNTDAVDALVSYGADLRHYPRPEVSPLRMACCSFRKYGIAMVEKLLQLGCDPTALCRPGDFFLHRAAKMGECQVAELLLKYGAKVNFVNDHHETALLSLSRIPPHCPYGKQTEEWMQNRPRTLYSRGLYGFLDWHLRPTLDDDLLEVAKLLLAHGAQVNTSDCNRSTPLHYAIAARNDPLASLLRNYGANDGYMDCYGYKPADLALPSAEETTDERGLWSIMILSSEESERARSWHRRAVEGYEQ